MRPSKQHLVLDIIERPNEPERGFLAREFVVCTLPHRDPKKPTWVKSNGDFSLVLSSGVDKKGEFIGLPSGSIPKLLLFWFVTSAIKTQSRHIQLGDSLNGFLREVGLDPKTGGGKRRDERVHPAERPDARDGGGAEPARGVHPGPGKVKTARASAKVAAASPPTVPDQPTPGPGLSDAAWTSRANRPKAARPIRVPRTAPASCPAQ